MRFSRVNRTLASTGFISLMVVILALMFGLPDQSEAATPPGEPSPFEQQVDDQKLELTLDDTSFLAVTIPVDEGALLSGFASEHVVRATNWDDEIFVDDLDRPGQCEFVLRIPIADLEADHPADRERMGMTEMGDWERNRVDEDMRDEGQLHEDRFPYMMVESVECRRDNNGGWQAQLDVRIRGESQQFDVPLDVQWNDDEFALEADFQAEHADFGMEPYSAVLGTLRNGDPLHFFIEATGRVVE